MTKNSSGLTILESLVVMTICVVLLWIVVPVGMVRLGYKEAGAMVVTEGDKAPQQKDDTLDPKIFRPRVEKLNPPAVIDENQFIARPPVPPKKDPLK